MYGIQKGECEKSLRNWLACDDLTGGRRRKSVRYHSVLNTWHTAAYTASNAAGATNADTAALTDSGVLYITNSHFLFQRPMVLLAIAAMGANLTKARLDSGNIRYYGQPYIRPFILAATPGSNYNLMALWDNPFALPPREEIAAQLSNSAGAPEQETVLLFLQVASTAAQPGEGYTPAPAGPYWAVRFTGTTAVTANKWTIEPFTLETGLPSGVYWMIHLDCQSTNIQAARMFFDTQFWRPGMIGLSVLSSRHPDFWRPGMLGTMNSAPFVNDRLPALEILANGADASFEGYYHIKPASPPSIQLGTTMGMGATGYLPFRAGA